MRPSSAIDAAFIFCIKLLRWTFTVVSLMPRSAAICLLRRPCAHLNHYFPLSAAQCFEPLLHEPTRGQRRIVVVELIERWPR